MLNFAQLVVRLQNAAITSVRARAIVGFTDEEDILAAELLDKNIVRFPSLPPLSP